MSREKDAEEGDRRGLVEEGTVCPPDNTDKTTKTKDLTEAKWVSESVPEVSTAGSAMVVTNTTTISASESMPPVVRFIN